ncbi:hypothetical protein JG688_00004879 [Phytophthora aleatoria]|uniref:Uncharacterized protein n=1 Tax=Phytophthora aleatoria TaxID=2496075 RepID=A0A8J5J8U5_9STRA|nr:hypothetical protein JG688_00004879 [Phytophthora aleatoria]
MQMMAEALNNLLHAREELAAMLLREADVINELTATIGGAPGSSGYIPSYELLRWYVIRILSREPTRL